MPLSPRCLRVRGFSGREWDGEFARNVWRGNVIAKFHYTDATGPDRTRTDFFAAPVSEKLRWVRAGLRQSPCGSGRARVVEFSLY